MFDALRREIQDILGENFAVFFEYNTNQETNEAILNEYKNVAVLYVNYGDLKLLEGNQGLTGALQLELLLSVKEGAQLESVVSAPLYNLINKQNGKIEGEGGPWTYVLNYHAPTSTGEIHTTTEGVDYVVYSLPMDVTVTATLMLGEQFELQVWHNKEWKTLNNYVRMVLNPKVTLNPYTLVNGNVTKSSATAKVWGARIDFFFDIKDPLHKDIYKVLDRDPETVWKIRYSVAGDDYTERTVLFFDSNLTFERGQFTVSNINMCEAG